MVRLLLAFFLLPALSRADYTFGYEQTTYDASGAVSATATAGFVYVTGTPRAYEATSWVKVTGTGGLTYPGSVMNAITQTGAGTLSVSFWPIERDGVVTTMTWGVLLAALTSDTQPYRLILLSDGKIRADVTMVGGSGTQSYSSAAYLVMPGRPYRARMAFQGTALKVYLYDVAAGIEALVIDQTLPNAVHLPAAGFTKFTVGVDQDGTTWPISNALLDQVRISSSYDLTNRDPSIKWNPGVTSWGIFRVSDGEGMGSAYVDGTYRGEANYWFARNFSNIAANENGPTYTTCGTMVSTSSYQYGGPVPSARCVISGGSTSTIGLANLNAQLGPTFPNGGGTGVIVALGGYGMDVIAPLATYTTKANYDAMVDTVTARMPLAKILYHNSHDAGGGGDGSRLPTNAAIYDSYLYQLSLGRPVYWRDFGALTPWSDIGADTFHGQYTNQQAVADLYYSFISSLMDTEEETRVSPYMMNGSTIFTAPFLRRR